MSSFMERALGAAKLDVNIYEEVEADTSATAQAAGLVVLASVAAGIGTMASSGLMGLVVGTLAALIGWVVWAALIWLIGAKLLPEANTDADMGQLMRTIGFAAAPGVLKVLGFIPILGWLVVLAASLWMLVAMVIAVRQALDYESTGRAVGVCLIGWVVQVGVMVVIMGVLAAGGPAPAL